MWAVWRHWAQETQHTSKFVAISFGERPTLAEAELTAPDSEAAPPVGGGSDDPVDRPFGTVFPIVAIGWISNSSGKSTGSCRTPQTHGYTHWFHTLTNEETRLCWKSAMASVRFELLCGWTIISQPFFCYSAFALKSFCPGRDRTASSSPFPTHTDTQTHTHKQVIDVATLGK